MSEEEPPIYEVTTDHDEVKKIKEKYEKENSYVNKSAMAFMLDKGVLPIFKVNKDLSKLKNANDEDHISGWDIIVSTDYLGVGLILDWPWKDESILLLISYDDLPNRLLLDAVVENGGALGIAPEGKLDIGNILQVEGLPLEPLRQIKSIYEQQRDT